MKRLYTLLFLLIICSEVKAQPYENSWINYSQTYYKIKVWQDGIYRIQLNTLLFAGIPATGIDNRTFQVFHNGVEQYIYVHDQNGDHFMDGSDYIEFYGQRNDGSLDARMYADSSWQPNANYSLYTDTAIYFLTTNTSLSNRRLTLTTDTNFTGYSPAAYFTKESYLEETSFYNEGTTNSYGGTDIDYTETEGWMDGRFNSSGPIPKTLNTQNIFPGGPNIEINTAIAGANNNPHSLTINFPGVNFSDLYTGYLMKRYSFSVSPATFTSSTTTFTYAAHNTNDYNAFVSLSVKYPHTYDLENASKFKLFVQDDPQGKTRMEITNFNTGSSTDIVLYDLTNHKRILTEQSGATLRALVDNDGQSSPKTCYLASGSQIINVASSSIGSFLYVANNQGLFNNFLAAAKDSAYIIITNRALWSQVSFYKTYRDFTTGNKVVLVDIDELYDQFAYGIKKHPLAIKNFVNYILDNWTLVQPPEAMFIIGKSIAARFCRYSGQNSTDNLVPSYGNPPSDILLSSGINGSLYDPKIPVGRLSARDAADVQNYLDKIQQFENAQAAPPEEWMKEVLHFGGGTGAGEQSMIQSYLNAYKAEIEDSLYGGRVTSYFKTSGAAIVYNQSAELQNRINSGVSLMTFFGHASGSDFDQSTDIPENYNNKGKYPLVLANSCFAGDIHTTSQSISERFVTLDQKGSIAFIASVGLGDAGFLFKYSDSLYKNISYKHYGQPIGRLMQQTILQVQDSLSIGTKTICQEMTLEGDPGIKFNNWKQPDLLMSPSNIYFSPNNITTELDTFNVHVIVRNIARATADSFNVIVLRTFPNGYDSVYTQRIANCYYSDTLQFNMRVNGSNSAGINRFLVTVDLPQDTVDELDDYLNNTATADLFITSPDIIPVYPTRFAIVPYSTTALKASTLDPLAGIKTYRFEMDTSYQAFGNPPQPSPMFRFATITDSGGVITWNNNVQLGDSVVYYWRVANDSVQIDPVKYKWRESSFIYIPAKTGWSQKHFYQFKDNTFTNVLFDSLNRRFNFIINTKTLDATTFGTPVAPNDFNSTGYLLNNSVQDYTNGCSLTPAVMIAIIDSTTLEPWTTCNYNFNQINRFTVDANSSCSAPYPFGVGTCRPRPEKYFIFNYNATDMQNLNAMLSSIPNGNYILAYSWFTTAYSTVDPNFNSALAAAGFNTSLLQDNTPYIFFIKKGDVSTRQEVYGAIPQDTLHLSALLTGFWDRGSITSELIGPSAQWNELHWGTHALEPGVSRDSVALHIYGLNSTTNSFDTLRYGMQTNSSDTTLSWVSAAQYPYLKLELFVKDDSIRTPPQLDKWQIYYDELPECAVNANNHFSFHADPVSEGDTVRMSIAIENIGNKPMDSLRVDFYLYDNSRVRHTLKSLTLDSLHVAESILANVEVDTTFGLAGNNSLWVEANPFGLNHQPEQQHFNNLAEMKFKVNRDFINPILDVTFDAVHILDGDIVSGKPVITIQLHDENKFLALNDTSNFRVHLKTPSGNTEKQIYFTIPSYGSAMRFTPAVLPKNSCRIDWSPVFTEDGTYVLDVEAADKSKNESGKFNYRITFEVVNRSTITEVLNYPNPFSTSTRFVFTLTGNEIPNYMKIQIMTVTGKIVREITQNELGNIHIGRNITDYAWDGKDEYGDQLANGLYLYRVITNINGSQVEHRETEADKYFKKGWGKMYLMR